MKLFIGREAGPWPEDKDEEIREQLLKIRLSTEKPLEEYLADRDYGPGLKALYLIPMILRPDVKLYEERKKYNGNKGEADYRLIIDYNKFVAENEEGKRKLIVDNLLGAIRLIDIEVKKKKLVFDYRKMVEEINNFLRIVET